MQSRWLRSALCWHRAAVARRFREGMRVLASPVRRLRQRTTVIVGPRAWRATAASIGAICRGSHTCAGWIDRGAQSPRDSTTTISARSRNSTRVPPGRSLSRSWPTLRCSCSIPILKTRRLPIASASCGYIRDNRQTSPGCPPSQLAPSVFAGKLGGVFRRFGPP
jgi:hypothetical protein